MNNRDSPWIERPNLVAHGVGLQSKNEQSVAWQILPSQSNVRYVISLVSPAFYEFTRRIIIIVMMKNEREREKESSHTHTHTHTQK